MYNCRYIRRHIHYIGLNIDIIGLILSLDLSLGLSLGVMFGLRLNLK